MSAETRALAPEIPWREVGRTRDRITHGYASVDARLLWDIGTHDLAPLIAAVERLLPDAATSSAPPPADPA